MPFTHTYDSVKYVADSYGLSPSSVMSAAGPLAWGTASPMAFKRGVSASPEFHNCLNLVE